MASLIRGAFTGLARRIASGLAMTKDFGVTWDGDYGWQTINSGGRSAVRYAGSDLNWESEAGEPTLNSVIAICMQYVIDQVAKPELQVALHASDGSEPVVANHPLIQLMRQPNPEYRGRQMLGALGLSYKIAGNAYIVKDRGPSGVGPVRALWYIPHFRMFPIPPADGGPTQFYAFKTYKNGTQVTKAYPRGDVIHIKNGTDPLNPRLGFSPLRAQLRSIVSDNEIDVCTAVVLRNMGIFGALITPDGDAEFGEGQPEEIRRRLRNETTGDGRGDAIVLGAPVKVQFASRTPQELALATIGDRPQARICAAFQIDPAAIGLLSNAGGKGEKYGSLRKEARQSSFENGIIPMLSVIAEDLTHDLGPEFDIDPRKAFVRFDYSKVRDLQEDTNAQHERAREDFEAGGTTLDEFRAAIGLAPCEDPELGRMYDWQLEPTLNGPSSPSDKQTQDAATGDGEDGIGTTDDENDDDGEEDDENDGD